MLSHRLLTAAGLTAVLALATGCGHSGAQGSDISSGQPATNSTTTASDTAPGVFGTAGKICEPGNAAGGIGRGVTKKAITIGTFSDAGAALAPGLDKEYWEAADGFVKWCNAAGGINGRKINLIKHDAKLFGTAPEMVKACGTDFMLVGGGTLIDEVGVKPRLKCKLPGIFAFELSDQAIRAPLQVSPNIPGNGKEPTGAARLMAAKFPEAVQHFGSGSADLPALIKITRSQVKAFATQGVKTVNFQISPIQVDNWRPYVQRAQKAGVQVLRPVASTTAYTPYVQAMNDVGYKPTAMWLGGQDYLGSVIDAAKATKFPPTWLGISLWPLELANKNPPTAQAITLIKAAVPGAKINSNHIFGMNSWVLWAKSASACGNDMTSKCILAKAKAETSWTGGGIEAPVDNETGMPSECVAMMKVTPKGFVLDKDLTKPNYRGVFNCDKRNITILK
jgi:ABC-type branched-subunit amino acid transport system substrate-binding protein